MAKAGRTREQEAAAPSVADSSSTVTVSFKSVNEAAGQAQDLTVQIFVMMKFLAVVYVCIVLCIFTPSTSALARSEPSKPTANPVRPAEHTNLRGPLRQSVPLLSAFTVMPED